MTTNQPYYSDTMVTLYHGKMEEVVQDLTDHADAVITDPPYGETALAWDRWVDGWPLLMTWHTNSMWCFGSMRMFTDRWSEFKGWKLAQDIVWEKHNGTGFAVDRFKRVHEHVVHFYHGDWSGIRHETPRVPATYDHKGRVTSVARTGQREHTGEIGDGVYVDDGLRLMRSVVRHPSVRRGLHPTEKPGALLSSLIEYSVPPGGLVLDPFAGSASTLLTARSLGRRAIGIEGNEEYCEKAAKRLAEPDLYGGAA